MENRRLLISGLIGGFATAVLSSIPFVNFINCFCCLGILLGGVLALWYYDHSSGITNYIGLAQAVTIGITAGIIGAFISMLIGWIVYLKYGHWDIRFLQSLLERMEEIPEYTEDLLQELEAQTSAGFKWTSLLLSNLIIYPLFCLMGSLLTRLFLNKKRPRP
jgi:hypothetical protein